MTPAAGRAAAGTLVLDCEALSRAVLRDRDLTAWLALARADDLQVVTPAVTLVEAVHPRINRAALAWTVSRIVVKPVTEEIARTSSALLADAGMHGHRHALDAIVCATALAAAGPATILTSDPDDLRTLTAGRVSVIPL